MVRHGALRRAALAVGLVAAGWLVSGCGGAFSDVSGQRATNWPTVTMVAFADQWAAAKPRYYDIADLLFKKTLAAGTIQFRYNPNPTAPYLVGEIKGTGLKPNFCYQLKLVGKPGITGGGLWPTQSDAASNKAILVGGRWSDYWAEATDFNTTDPNTVMQSADYKAGWVAGYVYFGYVLTDENGNITCYGGKTAAVPADSTGWVPISANRCYHITGKSGQEGMIGLASDTQPIPYTIARTGYGYDTATDNATLSLWYEKEGDNSLDFSLPAGTHDVVLMVTEESFHNDGAGNPDGGFWDTVWVSDWSTNSAKGAVWTGQRGGRIQFTTRAATPQTHAATVATTWVKSGRKYLPQTTVLVTNAATGAPLSGAKVSGFYSGAYASGSKSATTGTNGQATISGPANWSYIPGVATFTVTNITKTGYTWDGVGTSG